MGVADRRQDGEFPLNRWGRLSSPPESAGGYLLIEKESADGWKVEPPEDAIRVWHRKPGPADDDNMNNWTVWLHRHQLLDWMTTYAVEEWLPEGTEPTWE